MAEFADRMASLTRHLRSSIQMRNEARKQIRDASAELSSRNQAFMAHVAEEHQNRAEELRESLAAHSEERREKAEALRNHNQESLAKMRDDLNNMLSETHKARKDTVDQLFETFQHARNELALDLREASFAWQAFAAGRDEPAAPKTKSVASAPAKAHAAPAVPAKKHAKAHTAAVTFPEKPSRKHAAKTAKPTFNGRKGK
jgi:seryl-tRNA synthetase